MTSLHVIALVGIALLEFPFAYAAYRIVGARSGSTEVTGALWFGLELIAATVLVEEVWERTVPGTPSGWLALISVLIDIVGVALVMAAIDRTKRAVIGSIGRYRLSSFFAASVVAFLSLIIMTRFVMEVYFLEDTGSDTTYVGAQSKIGSPSGPQVGLASHIGYYILRPVRGAVVTILSERVSRVAPDWQAEVPDRLHFRKPPTATYEYIGRVVGMPGELVMLDRGVVTINGKRLDEPYVVNSISENENATVRLGATDYVLAEDVRKNRSESPYCFYVVHEKQIQSRQLFIVWPIKGFGFVQAPPYNIPNPSAWNLRISERWLQRLAKM